MLHNINNTIPALWRLHTIYQQILEECYKVKQTIVGVCYIIIDFLDINYQFYLLLLYLKVDQIWIKVKISISNFDVGIINLDDCVSIKDLISFELLWLICYTIYVRVYQNLYILSIENSVFSAGDSQLKIGTWSEGRVRFLISPIFEVVVRMNF